MSKADMTMTMTNAFQLSRVYAQGWNAALQRGAPKKRAPANPYPSDPERARWNEGFAAAGGKSS